MVGSVTRKGTSPCWGRVRKHVGGQTNLLENRRLEPGSSCDGEPAPDRELPAILFEGLRPPGKPNGEREGGRGSMGELLAEGEPERG
jgi:hypothetical protein